MTGTLAVVMVFSIPIIAIITDHFQKQSKIRHKMILDEIELEKVKQSNYLLETEKMRLELQQMQLEDKNNSKIL